MEQSKELYRGITFITIICYILLLFVHSNTEIGENIIKLIKDTIFLTSATFATLWTRKQVSLFSLILYLIAFNLIFLKTPILFRINYFNNYEFSKLSFGILIVASIFLFIGFWDKCPIKLFKREFYIKDYMILIPTVLLTFFIQFIPRIIR